MRPDTNGLIAYHCARPRAIHGFRLDFGALLGGSWVVISGVMSRVTIFYNPT